MGIECSPSVIVPNHILLEVEANEFLRSWVRIPYSPGGGLGKDDANGHGVEDGAEPCFAAPKPSLAGTEFIESLFVFVDGFDAAIPTDYFPGCIAAGCTARTHPNPWTIFMPYAVLDINRCSRQQ